MPTEKPALLRQVRYDEIDRVSTSVRDNLADGKFFCWRNHVLAHLHGQPEREVNN